MRVTSKKVNHVRAKAFAGSTGVLIAFNIDESATEGLLGFAVERHELSATGSKVKEHRWLAGMLNFPGLPHEPGQLVDSKLAPIQKFRWSDYSVNVATRYRYIVHPVYGEPGALDIQRGPKITLSTLSPSRKQFVIFNRAVGASQAFARKFPRTAIQMHVAAQLPGKKRKRALKKIPLPPEAMEWLSRGLFERIRDFIGEAKRGQALDLAIYEFQLPDLCDTVKEAINRGVDVRLLIHCKNAKDKTTKKNRAAITKAKIPFKDYVIKRKPMNLMHDKFVVLSDLEGEERVPSAVLMGSTNFTQNGVYYQGNVVHVIRSSQVARSYLEQFERMRTHAQKASETKKETTVENELNPRPSFFAGFSPRSDATDLGAFEKLVLAAKRDVLFLTAFKQIVPKVLKALGGKAHDEILRIGLQNAATSITGFHRDRSARFVTPAMLKKGFDGWLVENKPQDQEGNIFIHAKTIVIDFTSDHPTIISGSHNFTNPASAKNDENYLIVKCQTKDDLDAADAYGVEVMRLYDHYRFRWATQHATGTKAKVAAKDPPELTTDDSWTDGYFGDDVMKTRDRKLFCP